MRSRRTAVKGSALALLFAAGVVTAFAAVAQPAESRSQAVPTVRIASIHPNPGYEGLAVVFQADGQDADGDAITYAWTFGDGTSGSPTPSNYVSHRYQRAGTYTVSVVASAGNQDSQPATATVEIEKLLPSGTPPTPPGNVRVTAASETSVMLAWDASQDDDGVASYGILGGPGPQTTTGTSHTLTGLACDEAYVFELYAQDTLGAISDLVSVTAHTSACSNSTQTGTTTTTPSSTGSGTGPGGTVTAPTTTSSGGGSPPSSLSVSSVKTLVVGHGARRRVVLTLSVNQNARARVLLLKGARTVASKRSPVKKGTNRLTLAVPRKARAGAYTLRITVSTAKGDTRGIRRKVRLPR